MITPERKTRLFSTVLLVAATVTVILIFLAVTFTAPKAHMQGELVWCFDVTVDAKGGVTLLVIPPGSRRLPWRCPWEGRPWNSTVSIIGLTRLPTLQAVK